MRRLISLGVAQVRAQSYRVTTERSCSGDLVVEIAPLLQEMMEQGALRIEVERLDGNRVTVTAKEWGDG